MSLDETDKQDLFGYYIIPQYQYDLEQYNNLSKKGQVSVLSETQALMIISQVMKALQAIHYVGYNHNDIKPANSMIDILQDD